MLALLITPRRHPSASPRGSLLFLGCWWLLGLVGCASLPADVVRPVSTALQAPQDTALGHAIEQRRAAIATPYASGFRLLGSTEAAYGSRLALVDAAQKTLDLQYYAILAGPSTRQIALRLRQAAARGVRVRILLDDFNTTGDNAHVLRLAFAPNIELRLFNPLPGSRRSLPARLLNSLDNLDQAQRRMHNKMFIADNAIGIAGGRNLGDAYFGQNSESNFVDLDVLAAGGIVRRMSASFDAYWNSTLAYPVLSLLSPDERAALQARPIADASATEAQETPLDLSPERLTWAPSLLLADKADKIAADTPNAEDTVVDGLLRLMARTRHDLFIVSPYFVPGKAMMDVFAKLRAADVRIRVLTNSLASTDAPLAHVGYARHRRRLLEMGVELYEMRPEPPVRAGTMSTGFTLRRLASAGSGGPLASTSGSSFTSRASLHAKTLVLDSELLVVGSMNLDLRSQLQNSELALLIRSTSLASRVQEVGTAALLQDAYHVGLQDGQLIWTAPDGTRLTGSEPEASAGLQFMLKLLGPFAPDALL